MAILKKTLPKSTPPGLKKSVGAAKIEEPRPEGKPDIVEWITRRRKQIMVHSVIYYRMADSLWSDFEFDRYAKQLVQLQADYPKEASEAIFAEEFKDFDGTTGFQFIDNPWAIRKAEELIKYKRGEMQ